MKKIRIHYFMISLASLFVSNNSVGNTTSSFDITSCTQHLTKTTKPLPNLSDVKKRIERYYECGKYDKDLTKIINKAINYFARIQSGPTSVVIFDIDDTALTDYADQKSISFGYIPKLSHEWILEADAPAIPQVKRLYDYLINRGFKIIFLTGRKHDEYDATIKNLKQEGYTNFDKLIVRSSNEKELTAQEYKSRQRKQLVKDGYTIVGSIGDQWSDLTGGNVGHRVKLPNYRYKLH